MYPCALISHVVFYNCHENELQLWPVGGNVWVNASDLQLAKCNVSTTRHSHYE